MYFKFVNWSLGVIFSFASLSQCQKKTKAFNVYYEYFHIDVPYEKEGDVIDVIDDGGGDGVDDDDDDVSSPLQSLDPSLPPAGLIYLLANRMRPQAYVHQVHHQDHCSRSRHETQNYYHYIFGGVG